MRLCLGLILLVTYSFAQEKNQFYLSAGTDVIKTDNDNLFDKTQSHFDVNYFFTSKISAGYGMEIRTGTGGPGTANTYFGLRYYLIPNLFLKPRYILGNKEFALAAGWAHPIHEKWRLEGTADYYTKEQEFGFRIGVGRIIN
jgi:hypothetical protein